MNTATVATATPVTGCVVPREIAVDAVRVLDDLPGIGPIMARRLRPYLASAPRREVTLSPHERWTALQDYARSILDEDVDPRVVDAVLASWAPTATRRQWDDFMDEVRDLARLETGEADWRAIYPELAADAICPEEIAIEQKQAMVWAASWLLVYPGERRCRDCARTKEFPTPAVTKSDLCQPCGIRAELRVAADHDIRVGRVS